MITTDIRCDDGGRSVARTGRAGYSAAMSSVQIIEPKRFSDDRGWLAETYTAADFAVRGINSLFVQDNHTMSRRRFTLRGLHCQAPPFAQAKLVRCIKGCIFDVAVDVRNASPTYGKWTAVELSAENGRQLFIPEGYAHGFLTLEDDCEVVYKCSALYAPDHDGGICWDDSIVAVAWPLPAQTVPQLSAKDRALPALAEFASPYSYDGQPLVPVSAVNQR